MAADFRYVSCVKGKLVSRFGTGTFIGAVVDVATGVTTFDENEVIAIPLAEWTTYGREYGRAMRNKDLVERSGAEHEAWQKAQADASAKAAEEAAKAAAAAAAAPAQTEPASASTEN